MDHPAYPKMRIYLMPLPLYQKDQASPLTLNSLASVQAVVAIAAGKGGVGKSSVTVNLALALQAQGYQVGIMDTDIYGPSIRKMLPEDDLPTQKGGLIQPALCRGIKMISMAYFRKEGEATVVRAPIANGLIAHFIKNIQWGTLDFLLVDFPPGTGDVQLTLSQQAHLMGALMVTTPQEVALLDVRKAISLFEQVKVPIIGIIENMSYYQAADQAEPVYLFGRGGGERLAFEAGAPFLGNIPLDPILCSCGDEGQSLLVLDPEAKRPITRAFQQLAKQLVQHVAALKMEREQGLGAFELVWKEMTS
jgi:ATP-binding protein involved in chromosome partitioning